MKKQIAIVLLLVSVLTCLGVFTGCDPGRKVLNVDELLANTAKIELVYYENEKPTTIKNLDGKKKPIFDFNKVTPIATLDDSKMEAVIKDLGEYSLLYWGRTDNEPIEKTLILYQSNGDMLVLYGCIYEDEKGKESYPGACIMFDKDGTYIEYIGDFGYLAMEQIETKYFSTFEADTIS